MKKTLLKIFLFASPVLALWGAELALPPGAFTFRTWESLLASDFPALWPGPFYPERRVERMEPGDLAPHTAYARPRPVAWETDRFGFRKFPGPSSENPDIVIVGDSQVTGSGITQTETLAEAVQRKTGQGVYPFAPAWIGDYLGDERFGAKPPKLVVYAINEGAVKAEHLALPQKIEPAEDRTPRWKEKHRRCAAESRLCREALIFAAQARQRFLLRWLRARANEALESGAARILGIPPRPQFKAAADGSMIFPTYEPGPKHNPFGAPTEEVADSIRALRDNLAAAGSLFVFAPHPMKTTVYRDLVPGGARGPEPLQDLTRALRARGVVVADIVGALENRRKAGGPLLFLSDDTHWSPEGVETAAAAIAEAVAAAQKP